jgi:hypothetical protein
VYPSDEINLGLAPIIIVAGIAAVTLLLAGDQVKKGLEEKTKIEALRLQQKILAADKEMINKSDAVRKQWESWRKDAAQTIKNVATSIPGTEGLAEKLLGTKGASILVAGLVGIAALYFLIPSFRRN